jgi:transposase, IS30 family
MPGGRKQAPRSVRAEFWERVRSGSPPRDAGMAMGMGKGAERWFALAGGVKPNGPGPVSGRYLPLAGREEIAAGLARGQSYRVIGARLDPPRPACTISREVRRNGPAKRYRALRAQAWAEERARRPKTVKSAGNDELRAWGQRHLEMKWSPEQISARLAAEFPRRPKMRVSHETSCQPL